MAGFLVYWTYKVCKIRYDQTKLEVNKYSKYNAHIGLNVIRYFKNTENISSNKSLFYGWLCPGLLNIRSVGMFVYELVCMGMILY